MIRASYGLGPPDFCQRSRRAWRPPLVLGLFIALAIVIASANPACAQTFLDPTNVVKGQVSGWMNQATGWAQHIYVSLLVFELIALGVTTLLFRENLGEFFASFSLKIFIGGVYFWFMSNAGSGALWPQAIIDMFKSFGISLGGSASTSWLGAEGLTAAGAYFAAGPVAQRVAELAAHGASIPPNCHFVEAPFGVFNGSCDAAPVAAIISQSYPFTMITAGLGLMIIMAMAAIWLQVILVTIESYIVMGTGVLFIGFAGSRFTMPFSAGYFSYMFNVGVKFMVLYLVLGIEQQLMPAILTSAAATLGAAFLPGAEYYVLVPAAVGMVNVVIAAALVWTIPGFAGSFLSGQSSASGTAVLGQAIGSMVSASAVMSQLHHARPESGATKSAASTSNTPQTAAAQSHTAGITHEPFSPSSPHQSFHDRGSAAASAGHVAAAASPQPFSSNSATSIGITTGDGSKHGPPARSEAFASPSAAAAASGWAGASDPSAAGKSLGGSALPHAVKPLDQYAPAQITNMQHNLPEFRKAFAAGDMSNLDQSQREAIMSNDKLRSEAFQMWDAKVPHAPSGADRPNSDASRALALNAITQGVPRDIGQPSAVQIRLANPDKL